MKNEFSIDLLDPDYKSVSIGWTPLTYIINMQLHSPTIIRVIKIDARTGNVLSDELIQPKK